MSLVGNLEDLGLGDLLQILSLSQKSGILSLSSDQGTGRMVFRNGMVEAAWVKGIPNSLRDLLVSAGELEPAAFEAHAARSRELGVSLGELLSQEAGIAPERIEALSLGAVESAALEMFTWPSGEFCFDMRAEIEGERAALPLAQPLNAQYLAMEGLRLRDERARDAEPPVTDDAHEPGVGQRVSLAEDPLFGEDFDEPGESCGASPDCRADPEALIVGALVDSLDPLAEEGAALAGFGGAESGPVSTEAERPSAPQIVPSESADSADVHAEEAARLPDPPVVLIDPDVMVLDWGKEALRGRFKRVHVFQQADPGLSRIRQYLIRGQQPLVLIAPGTPIDPLSGIHGLGDFVKRLKAQAPRLVVLGVRGEDADPARLPSDLFDGLLVHPSRASLMRRDEPSAAQAAERFAQQLAAWLERDAPSARPARPMTPSASVSRKSGMSPKMLRNATDRLQQASSQAEVVPAVLDFAHAMFDRVAVLIVRAERVFVVAGRGVDSLEVDPLSAEAAISLPVPASGWLRSVLDQRRPILSAPGTSADEDLLAVLGAEKPAEAYLAPIESGGAVKAILYADQALGGGSLPTTQALEVVLQYAGLALDRAVLERALADDEAGPVNPL